MKNSPLQLALWLFILIVIPMPLTGVGAAESRQEIGGHWSMKAGERPLYFYRDGDAAYDLFSYHMSDANKDDVTDLRVKHDEQFLILESQGYPNHPTAIFPNDWNPNPIRVQKFTFRLPLKPEKVDRITTLPMGPIGVALNGVVFFNPFERGGMNAVQGYSEVWLDSCCGHPQQTGIYHYHKYPTCVKSPFPDDGERHSPVIGFAFDGFPIYGPYERDGVMAKDLDGEGALDVCNGHHDAERGYHYHVTPGKFPYIIGGYHGKVEASNSRMLNRAGTGAIKNNAEGENKWINAAIARVTPGTALRGQTHQVRITLNPNGMRRGELPKDKPSWVQFGPFEATKLSREGNVIVATLPIPEDASCGVLLDCHIEFGTDARPTVLKKNNAFRVIKPEQKR